MLAHNVRSRRWVSSPPPLPAPSSTSESRLRSSRTSSRVQESTNREVSPGVSSCTLAGSTNTWCVVCGLDFTRVAGVPSCTRTCQVSSKRFEDKEKEDRVGVREGVVGAKSMRNSHEFSSIQHLFFSPSLSLFLFLSLRESPLSS